MENLLKREKELKEQLSYIGGQINRNKRRLGLDYNALYSWKLKAYEIKKYVESNDDIDGLNLDTHLCYKKHIELYNINKDIEWKRESVKDNERAQRELLYEYKDLNRQLCKIQRRIKKRMDKINNQ